MPSPIIVGSPQWGANILQAKNDPRFQQMDPADQEAILRLATLAQSGQMTAAQVQDTIKTDPQIHHAVSSPQWDQISTGVSSAALLRNFAIGAGTGTTLGALGTFGGAAGGGSEAAGGGATAAESSVLPSTTIGTGAVPGIVGPASGTGAAAAGATGATGASATASGAGLWSSLSGKTAVGLGLDFAGNLIQSHQASKAADAQKAAEQQALALQTQVYQQNRAGLQPFTQLGTSTLGNLYRMTGQQAPQAAPAGIQAQTPPWGQAMGGGLAGRMPALLQAAGGPSSPMKAGGVTMRAPDGSTQMVPQEQVAHYQQLGAQVVG